MFSSVCLALGPPQRREKRPPSHNIHFLPRHIDLSPSPQRIPDRKMYARYSSLTRDGPKRLQYSRKTLSMSPTSDTGSPSEGARLRWWGGKAGSPSKKTGSEHHKQVVRTLKNHAWLLGEERIPGS